MIKFNKVIGIVLAAMMLLHSSAFANSELERNVTLQEFLNKIGIELTDAADVKYININQSSDIALSSTMKNAIRVRDVMEDGTVREYIVVGMQEEKQEYEPVSFKNTEIAIQNVGSRGFAPAELNNAPIYLTLQTTYTTNGSARQINPSGIIAYYSLSGTQQAIISSLNCRFTVYGAPLKGNTYINYAPPGYTYDGLRTGYEIKCTFSSMSPNSTYSATKVFPAGYYMNVDHPVTGGSTYEASGTVSTSSGVKSFNVYWSGL